MQLQNVNVLGAIIKIEDCIFQKSRGIIVAPGLLIQTIRGDLYLRNVTLSDSTATNGMAGLYLRRVRNINLQDMIFYNNIQINGEDNKDQALIYIWENDYWWREIQVDCNVYLDNIKIYNNTSNYKHASIQLDLVQNFIMNNCIFENNVSVGQNIYLYNVQNVTFSNNKFINNRALNTHGSAMFLQDITGILTMEDFYFEGNFGQQNGPVFRIENAESAKIKNFEFNSNIGSGEGVNMFITQVKNVLIDKLMIYNTGNEILLPQNSVAMDNIQELTLLNLQINDNLYNIVGNIVLETIQNLKIYQSTFNNNVVQNSGGALSIRYLENVEIKNLNFTQNKALNSNGGCIEFQTISQNLKIEDCMFQNNESGSQGGSMMIDSIGSLFLKNSTFEDSFSKNGGSLFLQGINKLQLHNIDIYRSKAEIKNGAIYINVCQNIEFIDIKIQECSSGSFAGGINKEFSTHLHLKNIILANNIAQTSGGGMVIYSCDGELLLEDIEVSFNQARSLAGGGIYLEDNKPIINLKNINLHNNIAKQEGGALFIARLNMFNIDNSNINNNESLNTPGGGIYIIQTNTININQVQLNKNKGLYQGGQMYISQTQNINILYCNFQYSQYTEQGGSLYISRFDKIHILKNIFSNNHALFSGGAVLFTQGNLLNITDCSFMNNSAQLEGGAIYLNYIEIIILNNINIENNNVIKDQKRQRNLQVNNQNMNPNYTPSYSCMGGAAYIKSCEQVNIVNVKFYNNYADYLGGALYIIESDQINIKNSQFSNNNVYFKSEQWLFQKDKYYFLSFGGAVYLETTTAQISNNNITYSLTNNIFDGNQGSSGSSILIYFAFQVNINLEFENNNFKNNYGDIGVVRILGQNDTQLVQQLQLSSIFSNNKLVIEQEELITSGFKSNERQISEDNFHFDLCPPGTYLKDGGKLICDQCLDTANCAGGYIPMVPREKYWREFNNTEEIYECISHKGMFCLGNDTCYQGHKGVLCDECDIMNGWTKTQSGTCQKCQSQSTAYLEISILFLGFTGFIIYTIEKSRMRLESRNIKRYLVYLWDYIILSENEMTGIIKIFINHCQIIYVSSQIELPNEATGFLGFITNVGENAGSNLTCVLDKDKYDESSIQIEVSLLGGIIEFALIVVVLLVYLVLYLSKRIKLYQFKGVIYSSLVVTFIMVQPGIVKNAFKFLMCKQVGDKKYSVINSNIECYDSMYMTTVLPLYGGILVFLLILAPGFMFFHLYKNRKDLNTIKIQRYLGILILDFKYKWFFWEFFNLYMKSLISGLSLYYIDFTIIKSCFIIGIVTTQAAILNTVRPQNNGKVTRLAITACLVQVVTFTVGLCQEQFGEDNVIYNYILVSLIIVSNIYFVIRVIQMLYPYYKVIIYSIIISYFKCIISDRLWNKIQLKQDQMNNSKFHWVRLRIAVRKFTTIFKIKQIKKFNRDIVFFSSDENEEIQNIINIEKLKKKSKLQEILDKRQMNFWLDKHAVRSSNNLQKDLQNLKKQDLLNQSDQIINSTNRKLNVDYSQNKLLDKSSFLQFEKFQQDATMDIDQGQNVDGTIQDLSILEYNRNNKKFYTMNQQYLSRGNSSENTQRLSSQNQKKFSIIQQSPQIKSQNSDYQQNQQDNFMGQSSSDNEQSLNKKQCSSRFKNKQRQKDYKYQNIKNNNSFTEGFIKELSNQLNNIDSPIHVKLNQSQFSKPSESLKKKFEQIINSDFGLSLNILQKPNINNIQDEIEIEEEQKIEQQQENNSQDSSDTIGLQQLYQDTSNQIQDEVIQSNNNCQQNNIQYNKAYNINEITKKNSFLQQVNNIHQIDKNDSQKTQQNYKEQKSFLDQECLQQQEQEQESNLTEQQEQDENKQIIFQSEQQNNKLQQNDSPLGQLSTIQQQSQNNLSLDNIQTNCQLEIKPDFIENEVQNNINQENLQNDIIDIKDQDKQLQQQNNHQIPEQIKLNYTKQSNLQMQEESDEIKIKQYDHNNYKSTQKYLQQGTEQQSQQIESQQNLNQNIYQSNNKCLQQEKQKQQNSQNNSDYRQQDQIQQINSDFQIQFTTENIEDQQESIQNVKLQKKQQLFQKVDQQEEIKKI